MKKCIDILFPPFIFLFLFYFNKVSGQDTMHFQSNRRGQWVEYNSNIYSVGIGGTQGLGIYCDKTTGVLYHGVTDGGFSVNISGEYLLTSLVGIGWQSGFNFYFSPYYPPAGPPYFEGTTLTTIEIPILFKVNFHVLELTDVNVRGQMDFYVGIGIGGNPAFFVNNNRVEMPNAENIYAIIHVGPQIGIRYWMSRDIGVFGEFGWGATFANFGFSFWRKVVERVLEFSSRFYLNFVGFYNQKIPCLPNTLASITLL